MFASISLNIPIRHIEDIKGQAYSAISADSYTAADLIFSTTFRVKPVREHLNG